MIDTDFFNEPHAVVERGAPVFVQDGSILPKKIFFHCCCAPCTEWPLYYLRVHGIEPQGYFYNPNIHPTLEWERRLGGLNELNVKHKFKFLTAGDSEEERWRSFVKRDKAGHCRICYAVRLYQTAAKAAELGYEGFSTSLLVSPYQNRPLILQLGKLAAKKFNLRFYGFDFRPGYHYGQDMAKRDGLYRQKFCGCIFSLAESDYSAKIAAEIAYPLENLPFPRPDYQQ